MTSNEAICKRISDLCKEQNITYYTLASRAAIPKSTLMNILSGTNTTVATINKICNGLGITMYEFFVQSILKIVKMINMKGEKDVTFGSL